MNTGTKERTFYPWSAESADSWIKNNKETIRVLGTVQRPYKNTSQQYTVVYYEEK